MIHTAASLSDRLGLFNATTRKDSKRKKVLEEEEAEKEDFFTLHKRKEEKGFGPLFFTAGRSEYK